MDWGIVNVVKAQCVVTFTPLKMRYRRIGKHLQFMTSPPPPNYVKSTLDCYMGGGGGIELPVFDLLTYITILKVLRQEGCVSKFTFVLKPPLTTCCPSHYFLKCCCFCCLTIVGSFVLFVVNVPSVLFNLSSTSPFTFTVTY